jgi:hypothetical protein
MNYYLQDATIKKMYKTSNDNLPLIYGHVYKTLKLNSNISEMTFSWMSKYNRILSWSVCFGTRDDKIVVYDINFDTHTLLPS